MSQASKNAEEAMQSIARIELWAGEIEQYVREHEALLTRTFWQRLKWLVLGR
jgi:hypothetical protein